MPSASSVAVGPLGGAATDAALGEVGDIVALPDGGFLLVGGGESSVLRVGPRGGVSLLAGAGVGFGGDGGPAVQARLSRVPDIGLMPDGSVLIADAGNCRVRRVWPNGLINTVAGSGPTSGCLQATGDGGPATAAQLYPSGVAPTADGGFLVNDDSLNERIRRVAPDGIITAVAGTGTYGTPQPGRPALESPLQSVFALRATPDGGFAFGSGNGFYRVRPDGILVQDIAPGGGGTLFFADDGSIYQLARGRIWKLNVDGARTVLAGGNRAGYFGGQGDPAIGPSVHPGDVETTENVETTADGEILIATRKPFARVLLVARADTSKLAIAVARESLPAVLRHQLRFRLTRAAMVDIELRHGQQRLSRSSRPGRAGLNTVALPDVPSGGPYTAYVRATAADGAVASDQHDVLVGGRLPTPVARRAIIPLFLSFGGDTPPPITRACRRFGPRRVDCVKADPDLRTSRYFRCTNLVAVVLRRSGYLYLRSYRCPTPHRSAGFKRRPRWLGPATQSLPLQRIYARR